MKFTLKQVEIQAALGLYLGAQGIEIAGKNVTYAFKSGRGGNGVTVAVDIESEGVIVLGTAKPAKLGQSTKADATKPVTAVDTIVGDNTQVAEVADTSAVAEVATEVAAEAAPATTLAEVEVAEVAPEFSAEVPVAEPVAEPEPAQEVEAAPVSTSNIFGD